MMLPPWAEVNKLYKLVNTGNNNIETEKNINNKFTTNTTTTAKLLL